MKLILKALFLGLLSIQLSFAFTPNATVDLDTTVILKGKKRIQVSKGTRVKIGSKILKGGKKLVVLKHNGKTVKGKIDETDVVLDSVASGSSSRPFVGVHPIEFKYYAQKGKHYVSVMGNKITNNVDYGLTGSGFFNTETDQQTLVSEYWYGLTDKLSFGVTVPYLIGQETKATTYIDVSPFPYTVTETSSSGLGDPDFNLKFTPLASSSNYLHLDLVLSPSLLDAEQAEEGGDGNAARGGNKFEIGATYIHDFNQIELKASYNITMFGDQEKKGAKSNATYESDASDLHQRVLGVKYYHSNRSFGLGLELINNFIPSSTDSIDDYSENLSNVIIDIGLKKSSVLRINYSNLMSTTLDNSDYEDVKVLYSSIGIGFVFGM